MEVALKAIRLIGYFVLGIMLGYLLGMILFLPSARASYQVSPATRFLIVNEVEQQARAYKMDPDIVLAVITVESNWNPYRKGKHGEIGLMQLLPEYFPTAKVGDVDGNIRLGVKHLAFVRAHCPARHELTWLTCYNNGVNRRPKHPTLHPYYKKVMNAYQEIKRSQFNK